MKNKIVIGTKSFLILLLTTLTYAVGFMPSVATAKDIQISGKADTATYSEVNLYRNVNGNFELVKQVSVSADGKYNLVTNIDEEDFFFIGAAVDQKYTHEKKNIYNVYLKPGEKVTINLSNRKMELVGKLSPENKALNSWYQKSGDFQDRSIFMWEQPNTKTPRILVMAEELHQEIPSFLKENKTKNAAFNKVFEDLVKFEWANAAIYRINYNGIKTLPDSLPSLKTLKDDYYVSDAALNVPFGLKLMPAFITHKLGGKKNFQLDDAVKTIKGDQMRREFMYMIFYRWADVNSIKKTSEQYANYFSTPESQERLNQLLEEVKMLGDAQTLTTINDDHVKLDKFKGKLVVIDYWATWCGNCITEHPHWKTLYEQYKNNDNIEFVSISVDTNIKAWKDYEEKHKNDLVGQRLHATNNFDLIKRFNVQFYPRFMMIGKDGQVIHNNAPRPSSPELKLLIEKNI